MVSSTVANKSGQRSVKVVLIEPESLLERICEFRLKRKVVGVIPVDCQIKEVKCATRCHASEQDEVDMTKERFHR